MNIKALALALLLALGGCAMHVSGLQDEDRVLYVFDDERQAFAEAHTALAAMFPNSPVRVVGGDLRGFTVAEAGLIPSDSPATYEVRVIPGVGRDGAGAEVRGYYVEVTARDGGLAFGRLTAKKIYRAIVARLAAAGRPVAVGDVTIGAYSRPTVFGP